MISDMLTVVWREMMILKRRFMLFLLTRMVSPLLYMVTFGLGLGQSVKLAGGGSYLDFVVSGIVALNSMMVCFNAVASPVCMSRILYMTFDEYQSAPISNVSYIGGLAAAASIRGLLSSFIIMVIAWLFGCGLQVDALFILILLVNCLTFSFIGVIVAMLAKSHESLTSFTTYVITPMSFLCGTFFRLDSLPSFLANAIYFLPLTPASSALRAIGSGQAVSAADLTLLSVYLPLTAFLACQAVNRVRKN